MIINTKSGINISIPEIILIIAVVFDNPEVQHTSIRLETYNFDSPVDQVAPLNPRRFIDPKISLFQINCYKYPLYREDVQTGIKLICWTYKEASQPGAEDVKKVFDSIPFLNFRQPQS